MPSSLWQQVVERATWPQEQSDELNRLRAARMEALQRLLDARAQQADTAAE